MNFLERELSLKASFSNRVSVYWELCPHSLFGLKRLISSINLSARPSHLHAPRDEALTFPPTGLKSLFAGLISMGGEGNRYHDDIREVVLEIRIPRSTMARPIISGGDELPLTALWSHPLCVYVEWLMCVPIGASERASYARDREADR